MTPHLWIALAGFALTLLVQTVALIRWFTHRELESERSRTSDRDAWRQELHSMETRWRVDIAAAKSEGADAQRKVTELELRMERTLKNHPTKEDIHEMLGPISIRLEGVYDELVRRGASPRAKTFTTLSGE